MGIRKNLRSIASLIKFHTIVMARLLLDANKTTFSCTLELYSETRLVLQSRSLD